MSKGSTGFLKAKDREIRESIIVIFSGTFIVFGSFYPQFSISGFNRIFFRYRKKGII